jgi:hypothetical protein
MKIGKLPITGSLLLLACMIFAAAKLESADTWVATWIPFVVAGVGLVFVGAITQKRNNGRP